MKVQASLLAHGPGYAVTPKHPPYGDYIVAIEKACSTMEPNSAEELRAEIRGLQPTECITSYDVSALFTSVCIESAITIIRNKLRVGSRTPQ